MLSQHKKYRKLNKYDLSGEFGIGYDSKGREFYFDLEDYDIIKNFTWCVSRLVTETKIKNNIGISMHRLILGYKDNLVVDHINHLCFDNRKENLRLATKIQNGQNRKQSRGWRYESKKKRYSSRIVVNKKEIHLGYFDNSKLARQAYVDAREKYFGEFAPQEDK